MAEFVPGALEMLILRMLPGGPCTRRRVIPLRRRARHQLGAEIDEFRRMIQAIERVLTPEG